MTKIDFGFTLNNIIDCILFVIQSQLARDPWIGSRTGSITFGLYKVRIRSNLRFVRVYYVEWRWPIKCCIDQQAHLSLSKASGELRGRSHRQLKRYRCDVQEGTSWLCCQSWQLKKEVNLCYLELWSMIKGSNHSRTVTNKLTIIGNELLWTIALSSWS
jgi:hypothetical protein